MTTNSHEQALPLGVSFSGKTGTLGVYSSTAESISLCILDDEDVSVVKKVLELERGANNEWWVSSTALKPGTKYALRADGPEGPQHGFNPTLNLIDPYAKAVSRDTAREYHCIAIKDDFDWDGVAKPNTPLDQTIIYEAHARGLTRGNNAIPDELRGTYAALGHQSTIEHLLKIGVTAVELLPIHMFISEPRLMNMGLINYWGYNSINFFAPHPRYATQAARDAGPEEVVKELKTAIRELHRAGIEVILDVVYNHTAEGGGGGLTYSYRGLDNAGYYRLNELGHYQDTTGCGNSLNFGNPHVVRLTLDSLRYWTEEMQIDGFRFDLATTIARNEHNHFDPNHPVLRGMIEDPTFAKSKLIVEPWDVGLGGWQTGNFPDRFSEWNDHYRDSVRRFWLTDVATAKESGKYWNGVADLATRLAGSQDIVEGAHGPLGSVNFVTAHDGFTLRDLVSYNVKHNQVNGESNRDGTNNNHSYNHGSEGDAVSATIAKRRYRSMRNLLGTLMFSAGIPMVTAGDERAKTQLGNNNAYCQDSKLSWVNWELSESQQALEETFAWLTKLRRENASLRGSNFGSFERLEVGLNRIRWYNASGHLMTTDDWHNAENRVVQRLSQHVNEAGEHNETLLVINGSHEEVEVLLPQDIPGEKYEVLWNSYLDEPPANIKKADRKNAIKVSSTSIQLLRALDAF